MSIVCCDVNCVSTLFVFINVGLALLKQKIKVMCLEMSLPPMQKPKICVWCSSSPYSWEFVQEFGDEFDITSIAIRYATSSFDYDYTIKVRNPIKLKPFSTLFNLLFVVPYLVYLITRYDKKCDCHVIHYLSEVIVLAMFLANPKKPIVYFTYGSDYRYNKLRRLFSILLNRFDLIMCGSDYVKKELLVYYGLADVNRIDTTLSFKIDTSFKSSHSADRSSASVGGLKIGGKGPVIFSPRALRRFYNHHLLVEAIRILLDTNMSLSNLQVIFIKYGDENYFKELLDICDQYNIGSNIIFIDNILSPKEMAEIYRISDITVSIPVNDGIGRSNIEAVLCGSVLLLNKNVDNYKILFRDGRYCKYVEPTPESISAGLKDLISELDKFKKESERIRIARFANWERNKKLIAKRVQEIIQIKKCGGKNGRR